MSTAELARHEKVRTWFAGAHHDELPEADQQRYLEALDDFLGSVGKDPDELVAFCFVNEIDGERSQRPRVEINQWIGECVLANGWTDEDAVRITNVIRGYLIHNGVLLQGPAWTKGML